MGDDRSTPPPDDDGDCVADGNFGDDGVLDGDAAERHTVLTVNEHREKKNGKTINITRNAQVTHAVSNAFDRGMSTGQAGDRHCCFVVGWRLEFNFGATQRL